jgi:hypothetical protein
MLPDGTFREKRRAPPVATRIFFWAATIAAVALALAFAAFALWIVLLLIPVAVVAALVAWVALRWQIWRARRTMNAPRRDIWPTR